MSSIEWTGVTRNPLAVETIIEGKLGWACRKLSPGCAKCYAGAINCDPRARSGARMGTGLPYTLASFRDLRPVLRENVLEQLRRMRKKTFLFPADMTDIALSVAVCNDCGHVWENEKGFPGKCPNKDCRSADARLFWPTEWIQELLSIFHTLSERGIVVQVLTKRAERLADEIRRWSRERGIKLGRNVWPGFSAENQTEIDARWAFMQQAGRWADGVVWVSYEPALGAIDFSKAFEGLIQLGWGVVGGESGRDSPRPFDVRWARSAVQQFSDQGCPLFVKQLGARPFEGETFLKLRHKKGGNPEEWPQDLRIREFPYVPEGFKMGGK